MFIDLIFYQEKLNKLKAEFDSIAEKTYLEFASETGETLPLGHIPQNMEYLNEVWQRLAEKNGFYKKQIEVYEIERIIFMSKPFML